MASLAVSRRVDDLHIGLNNFIALETSPSRVSNARILEKHVKREVAVKYQSISRQESRQFIGNEPPRQDASTYRIFPKQGAKTPFRPNSPAVGAFERKPVPGSFDSLVSQEAWNNALSSKTAQSSNRRDVPSPRRKEEVSDIVVDMMTTVQEYAMDSPTIPGYPPLRGTSRRFRKSLRIEASADCSEAEVMTPRATPVETLEFSDQLGDDSRTKKRSEKAERRASSMILPHGLAPLVIPANDEYRLPAQAYRPSTVEEEDVPPKVPPKSPKTLTKAFPYGRKTPTSASSCSSAPHTASSSVTSFSTVDTTASPKPWATPVRAHSPLRYATSPGSSGGRASPVPWSVYNTSNENLLKHKREQTSVDDRMMIKPTSGLRFAANVPTHQRGVSTSDVSVINRGRPMKRGEASLQRGLSYATKRPGSAQGASDLPQGMPIEDAITQLSYEESRTLNKQAQDQVARFEVLREKDVSDLSKELRILDERCEYLRNTHNSLRQGRGDLQSRMIAYIKSPRTAMFSRDNIAKQEEALADLDLSISGWLSKLEQADHRRQRIRQKLLEHLAAALLLENSSRKSTAANTLTTPPRSPDQADRSFSTERRDVESIRVYADSGVASLLASIEQEIGFLNDRSESNQSPNSRFAHNEF